MHSIWIEMKEYLQLDIFISNQPNSGYIYKSLTAFKLW